MNSLIPRSLKQDIQSVSSLCTPMNGLPVLSQKGVVALSGCWVAMVAEILRMTGLLILYTFFDTCYPALEGVTVRGEGQAGESGSVKGFSGDKGNMVVC